MIIEFYSYSFTVFPQLYTHMLAQRKKELRKVEKPKSQWVKMKLSLCTFNGRINEYQWTRINLKNEDQNGIWFFFLQDITNTVMKRLLHYQQLILQDIQRTKLTTIPCYFSLLEITTEKITNSGVLSLTTHCYKTKVNIHKLN